MCRYMFLVGHLLHCIEITSKSSWTAMHMINKEVIEPPAGRHSGRHIKGADRGDRDHRRTFILILCEHQQPQLQVLQPKPAPATAASASAGTDGSGRALTRVADDHDHDQIF